MKKLLLLFAILSGQSLFAQDYYSDYCNTSEKQSQDIEQQIAFDWTQKDFPLYMCNVPSHAAYNTVYKLCKTASISDSFIPLEQIKIGVKLPGRAENKGYCLTAITHSGKMYKATGNSPQECLFNLDYFFENGNHKRVKHD
jgi:hypothetical protein